jgi:hypothetical protein
LVEAYLYFSNRIETWINAVTAAEQTGAVKSKEDRAHFLLQALNHDFCVVEIMLSDGDDSQEIFYSLNSQGRPLSQSDLLRSLIFMRAEKERLNRDEIFKDYWSRFETDFWSAEVKRGGRAYSRLDLGLRYFLIAKTGEAVDARRVNEEYRRWISAEPPRYASVKDELADFSAHASVYERYESAVPSKLSSTDLRRMLIDFDVSTVLPLVIFLEIDAGLDAAQLKACLALVESFIARRVCAGGETKEYNLFFVEVIKSLHGVSAGQIYNSLLKKLLSGGGITRHWPTDEELIDKAIRRPVGAELKPPALRVILERLEINLRSKKSENLDVEPLLQIEHVMPQLWAEHWPLNGVVVPSNIALIPFLAKDEYADLAEPIRLRNNSKQCLGNLSLLNKYLNPAASNGSFEVKLNEYKHSVLRLNRYFDSDLSGWDEMAIAERGKKLGEALCKIWPRPVLIEDVDPTES